MDACAGKKVSTEENLMYSKAMKRGLRTSKVKRNVVRRDVKVSEEYSLPGTSH